MFFEIALFAPRVLCIVGHAMDQQVRFETEPSILFSISRIQYRRHDTLFDWPKSLPSWLGFRNTVALTMASVHFASPYPVAREES